METTRLASLQVNTRLQFETFVLLLHQSVRTWYGSAAARDDSSVMGLFKKIASAMGRFRGNMRILVVGLDNSGKSTLIEHIKPNKVCGCSTIRYRELIIRRICRKSPEQDRHGIQFPGLSPLQLRRWCNVVRLQSCPYSCDVIARKAMLQRYTHRIHLFWCTRGYGIEPNMTS